MSCEAVSWVLHNSKARGSARLVLLVIAEHAHDDGTGSWPSVATIAQEAAISRASVFTSLNKLVASNELKLLRSGGGRHQETNLYLLTLVIPQRELPLQRVQNLDPFIADGSKLRVQRVQSLDPNHPEPPKKEKAAQPMRALPKPLRTEQEQRRIVEARDNRQLQEAITRAAAHIGSPPKSVSIIGGEMANVKLGYMEFLDLRNQRRLPVGMTWAIWQTLSADQQKFELERADLERQKAASA